jgi:hypothetical protein
MTISGERSDRVNFNEGGCCPIEALRFSEPQQGLLFDIPKPSKPEKKTATKKKDPSVVQSVDPFWRPKAGCMCSRCRKARGEN